MPRVPRTPPSRGSRPEPPPGSDPASMALVGAKEEQLYAELEQIEQQRRDTKRQLDRERLMRVTSDLVSTLTAPEFIEKMRAARQEAEGGAGLDRAGDLLSLSNLRRAGVDIPDDFRLTSRIFEDEVEGIRIEVQDRLGGDLDSLGLKVCGGGGTLGICACGGFKV